MSRHERGLLALAVLAWTGLCLWVGPPRNDFANYYTAAALFLEGTPLDRAYEYGWFTEQAWRLGFDGQPVGFAVLTPASALVMTPLAWLPVHLASLSWLVGQWGLGLLLGWLLARLAERPAWMGLTGLLLTERVWVAHLQQGQLHLPVVCLVAGALLAWRQERQALTGVLLAVAVGLKFHAWPLLVLAGLARRWRTLGAAGATLLVGGAVSVGLLGWPLHQTFFTHIAPRAASGWFVDPWHVAMGSARQLLHHLLIAHPVRNPDAPFHLPALASQLGSALTWGVVGLTLLRGVSWRTLDATQRERLLAAASIAALVSGVLLAHYHLALVLPAIALCLRHPSRRTLGLAALAWLACWVRVPQSWPEGPLAVLAIPRFWLLLTVWALAMPWRGAWDRRAALVLGLLASLRIATARAPQAAPEHTVPGPLIQTALREVQGELHLAGLGRDGWRDHVLRDGVLVPAGEPVFEGTDELVLDGVTYRLTDQGVGVNAPQLTR